MQATFMALTKSVFNLIDKLLYECSALLILTQLQDGKEISSYSLKDGIVFLNYRYCLGKDSKIKNMLLEEFHLTPSAGHCGVKLMMVQISTLYFLEISLQRCD